MTILSMLPVLAHCPDGRFVDRTRVDELILAGMIHDVEARLKSFEIAADVMRSLAKE